MDGWIDGGIGAALALAFVALTRAWPRAERALLAAGLLLAAVAYVGYGAPVRSTSELGAAFAGSALFGIAGLLGMVSSLWFLAAGWAVHGLWDLAVPQFADVSFMPSWYAAVCVGFDVVVALYVGLRASGAVVLTPRGAGVQTA